MKIFINLIASITLLGTLSSCAPIGKANSSLSIRRAQEYTQKNRADAIDTVYKKSMKKSGWEPTTVTHSQKVWLECYSVEIVDYLANVDTDLIVEMTGGDIDLMWEVARGFAHKACKNPGKKTSRDPAFALKKRTNATVITETNTYSQEDLSKRYENITGIDKN